MDANSLAYEFDDVRIEPGEFRVLKRGIPVNLEPKAFAVLIFLIERAGSLVLKDDILDNVWSQSFVTPNVLTRAVAQIRRELGDDRGKEGYIATVPKRGYRFIAELKCHTSRNREQAIAILPLTHLNPDVNNNYLGLGIADSLITKLSNIRTLTVRPTSSVLRFSAADDIGKTGRELKVGSLVVGSIQESGGTLRVTVQLIRVEDGKPLWGSAYTSRIGDIFEIQEDISTRVAESLQLQLTKSERERVGRRPTHNPEAYKLYMRGRFHLYPFTPQGQRKAIGLFGEAVEIDAGYALAHTGLAGAYLFGSQFGDDEACVLAEASARRAVELDPGLAEGHAVLAAIHFWKKFDPVRAEEFFRRALELDPNSSETNFFYAWFLTASSRFAEAIEHLKKAADLDPVSSSILVDQGLPYFYSKQFAKAREEYEAALEFDPSSWYAFMRLGEALEAGESFGDSRKAFEKALVLCGGDPSVKCLLARTLALCGKKPAARNLIKEVEKADPGLVSPYYRALAYEALGEIGEAVKALKVARVRRDKWFAWFEVDPRFEAFKRRKEFRDAE